MTSENIRESERFSSSTLADLAASAEARSKPIRYKTKSFSIHRESSEGEVVEERLVLEANTLSARSTNIRLQVWSDGAIWFGAFTSTKSGWAFQLAFTGYLGAMSNDIVISNFEESISQDFESERPDETKQQLLAVWGPVRPNVQGAT